MSISTPVATMDEACALVGAAAGLLYANGQTTRRVVEDIERLGKAVGYTVTVFPNWDGIVLRVQRADDSAVRRTEIVAVKPIGVDMNKVTHALEVLDAVCARSLDVAGALAALAKIAQLPGASHARFVVMAAAGAAALGVIFGNSHPVSLLFTAVSAGLGGALRRAIVVYGGSFVLQTLCAALVAGLIGAAAVWFVPTADANLVALCPCMVLMPGPHLLNGALDFAHLRIALGLARFGLAALVTLLICIGLIAGLAIGQQSLPPPGASTFAPLAFDVIAAGVAVAAFGSFFSMPWRILPIPIVIGMVAHGCRWLALAEGANAPLGAFIACLIVGVAVTLVANRMCLPFAAFAFASVVSLVPGIYLFRMAAELVAVMNAGPAGDAGLLVAPLVDGTTAVAIMLAMAFGLILPKLLLEYLFPVLSGLDGVHPRS